MADLVAIQPGRRPWAPGFDAVTGEIFHAYDQPLVGLVRQHGVTYLFQCLTGEVEPVSAWIYSIVLAEDLDMLHDEHLDFEQVLVAIAASRPAMLAMSDEDLGIVGWAPIEDLKSAEAWDESWRLAQQRAEELFDSRRTRLGDVESPDLLPA
jgi:hypothetical protein